MMLDRETNIKALHLIVLSAFWLITHLVLFAHYGIRSLVDSGDFIEAADLLLDQGRMHDSFNFFYIIHIGAIAFFRNLFPGQILPFIIFQCIVSAFAVLALYKASEKIFNIKQAGLISGIIFLTWIDNIHWNVTTMSESLFCSVTCFLVLALAGFDGKPRSIFLIIMLPLISLLIRPTGMLLILGTMVFLLRYYAIYLGEHKALRRGILTAIGFIVFAGANLMFTIWDFTEQYARGNIVTYVDRVRYPELNVKGLRITPSDVEALRESKPPLLKIAQYILNNPIEFLKTAALKIWYLISGIRPYYSFQHNVFTLAWMSAIYVAFYFGSVATGAKPILFFVLTVILANCVLIGISSVDWDNRFYIPMEPGIVVICGGGFVLLKGRLKDMLGRPVP